MNAKWRKIGSSPNGNIAVKSAQEAIVHFFIACLLTLVSSGFLLFGFLLKFLGLGTGLLTLAFLVIPLGILISFFLWGVANDRVNEANDFVIRKEQEIPSSIYRS